MKAPKRVARSLGAAAVLRKWVVVLRFGARRQGDLWVAVNLLHELASGATSCRPAALRALK